MEVLKNQVVRIGIKKPKRWSPETLAAFNGATGWVSDIGPEDGTNNITVTFPNGIVSKHGMHKSFKFLAEDLDLDQVPKRVPVAESQTRRYHTTNFTGLINYVENHNLTLVWDTSVELPRAVLWTQSEGMAGTAVLTNDGFLLTLDTNRLVDWW